MQDKSIPLISIKKMSFYCFLEVKMEIFNFGIFEISVKRYSKYYLSFILLLDTMMQSTLWLGVLIVHFVLQVLHLIEDQ